MSHQGGKSRVTLYVPTDSQNKGKPRLSLHIVVAGFPGLTFEAEQVLFTSTVLTHILLSPLEDDALLQLLLLKTKLHALVNGGLSTQLTDPG